MDPKKKQPIVCYCNAVTQDVIENAIKNGAHTLDDIYDSTYAGVGPCGGSCRPYLEMLLKSYLETQSFPDRVRPKRK
ncbi:MAG: (2Fe-2S)-binding protein [Bdellovibrionales bacterium]|nr:(2Fe-2S)-binding protein [Bdellovibrionales bacterium]